MRASLARPLATLVLSIAAVAAGAQDSASPPQDLFIAGVAPNQRPANAPVVTQVSRDGAWYALVLTGVSQPYPSSLKFLEDQGNWFSPFIHPGMKGPYDIRNWHAQP